PDKSWFCRVHPDPGYRLQTYLIELKAERESYLVAPALRNELATEPNLRLKLLSTASNRQGVPFLGESNLPRDAGRKAEWTRTMLEAIELATGSWVRVAADPRLLPPVPRRPGSSPWPWRSAPTVLPSPPNPPSSSPSTPRGSPSSWSPPGLLTC